MKINKKLTICIGILAMTIGLAGCGKVNVGYIDGTRVQQESPQLKTSIEELNGKMQALQEEAGNKLQEKVASGANEEEIMKLQKEYQMKMAGLQQQYSVQMKAQVDAAMNDVTKAKEIDVVLDSRGQDGLVISGGIDITEEVINKLQ